MNSFPAVPEPRLPHHRQLAKEIWEALGCKDELTKRFILATFMAIKVFDWKQGNYGPGNIQAGGDPGVRLRLSDKAARLMNLLKQGKEPVDETIEDTFGDCANYGLIGLMCRWGWWPGVDAPVRVAK